MHRGGFEITAPQWLQMISILSSPSRAYILLAFASNQRYTNLERKVNDYGKHIPCICKN